MHLVNDTILREQMAAFLYRLAGKPDYTPPAKSPFTDVSPSHTFYKHIAWLSEQKISTGYVLPGGRAEFRPGQPVLREQMAAFLYRYSGGSPNPDWVDPSEDWYYFNDVRRGHTFRTEINWLAETGITTGYGTWPHASYRPSEPVLREQMAAFLYRLVEALEEMLQIDLPAELNLPLHAYATHLIDRPPAAAAGGTWSIVDGTLPPGLTLQDGHLHGHPSATGQWPVVVGYTDPGGLATIGRTTIVVTDTGVPAPAPAMTRADLAMAMYAQANVSPPTMPANSPFSDLDESDASYVAAIWARNQSLMGGPDITEFRPGAVVTRADTALQIYYYRGAPAFAAPFYPPFRDVPKTSFHHKAITWLAATGLTDGEPGGLFHPDRPMTADELEEIFRRMREW